MDSFDKLVDISKLVFIWERVTYYYSHRYDPELGEFLNNPDIFSYKKEADTPEETEWRRKSLEIRKKVLGDKHIDVAKAFIAIGGKNNNLRALDILRSIYGDSHPDVAKAYISVGGESNNLKAIAILRSLYGDNHPDVAKAYQSIGGLGNNLMALRIMSTLYGEFFNDGANLCKEIAKGYFEEANLAKAVEYKIKELELRKKRFNEDNHFPLIGMTVDDFFSIYGKQQVLDFLNDSQIVPLEKKNLIIPNTIREIGERAFFDCQLTEVTIPESVTCIGYKAFEFCERLTKINLPNSVTVIECDAFSHCSKLTSIRIPDSVTEISAGVFNYCEGLKEIQIPGSVTKIGLSAFYGCTGLTEINIPNSVTEIGKSAFERCTGLTEIHIPDGVTKIGKDAFQGCTGIKRVSIPKGLDISHSGLSDSVQILIREIRE